MSNHHATLTTARGRPKLDRLDFMLAAVAGIATACVLFPGLGQQTLANWDEALYGVISRALLQRPSLTLSYGGVAWFDKPPLFYWAMAGAASLFGVTEFAWRLPSALCGIGVIILTYCIGRAFGGRSAGAIAALFLLGVAPFVALSRAAMLDVGLTFFGLLSVALLVYGVNSLPLRMAAGVAFGLAFLTKSVAAFVFLPGLVAIAIALRGTAALRPKELVLIGSAAILIPLPWLLWSVAIHGQAFLDSFIYHHIFQRFQEPLDTHAGDALYYLDVYMHAGWLTALVHGIGLALAAILAIWRKDFTIGALVIFAVGAFLIVSAPATKIAWYLVPVYPATALAAALGFTTAFRHPGIKTIAVAAAALLALPGIIHGRTTLKEEYGMLDFSPEVSELRRLPLFVNGRVPLLYVLEVSQPAPLFYLAKDVPEVDGDGLEKLIQSGRRFYCLAFQKTALGILQKHAPEEFRVLGTTEYLVLLEHPASTK